MSELYVRYEDGTHLPTSADGKVAFLNHIEQEIRNQLDALGDMLVEVRRLRARSAELSPAQLEGLATDFAWINPRDVVDELLGLSETPPVWWPAGRDWDIWG